MSVIKGYQIQGILAKGGMATIYLALQESLQRHVALKVLSPKLDTSILEHFLDESRIIASLKHPNIIPVFDVGRVGMHFYHAMEYIEGGDLELKITQGIDHNTALEIVIELSDALHLVHSKGIIHGDIKPANIVFRSDGSPVLTDFGISKRTTALTEVDQEENIFASPSYASPELMLGEQFDKTVDIYSLGIVLYEMLIGEKPFQGKTQAEMVTSHIQDTIPSLPKEMQALQPLINGMLAKNKNDRISDASVISTFIKKYLRDHPSAKQKAIIQDVSMEGEVSLEYISDKTHKTNITSPRILLPLLLILLSANIAFALWYFLF